MFSFMTKVNENIHNLQVEVWADNRPIAHIGWCCVYRRCFPSWTT